MPRGLVGSSRTVWYQGARNRGEGRHGADYGLSRKRLRTTIGEMSGLAPHRRGGYD